jgi:hypothetical protein
LIKLIRRVAIVAIVGLAYLYYRLFTGPGTLTQIACCRSPPSRSLRHRSSAASIGSADAIRA